MAGFMKLQVWEHKESGGYMARYSAPGYMDCTDDNGPFPTPFEAILETLSLYGDRGEGSEVTADEREAVEALIHYGMEESLALSKVTS